MTPGATGDEYASKLTEMVNGAMEEDDDIEDGGAFSDPCEGQSQPNRVPKDRIDELLITNEEIERFAKEGVNINYQEVASVLGDEAAQRGFQATGAYQQRLGGRLNRGIGFGEPVSLKSFKCLAPWQVVVRALFDHMQCSHAAVHEKSCWPSS